MHDSVSENPAVDARPGTSPSISCSACRSGPHSSSRNAARS